MKWLKSFMIISLMFLVVSGITNSKAVVEYINGVKYYKTWNESSKGEMLVKNYAKKHNQPAIEPRIDPIWKLIPGYNGLIIDEQATLAVMKTKNIDEWEESQIPFVWSEVEPKNRIKDLGAYPIYRGNSQKPAVSFLINVAWGTEYVTPILDLLKKEDVKATFFLDGSWLKKNPELANRMVKEGHELGNHGYSHPLMSKLNNERITNEIKKTEQLIQEITKQSSQYFAPPAGDFDQRTVNIASSLNMYTILWTLDTVDWKKPDPNTIINRIVPKVENGSLILMHPTKSTLEALPTLIAEIQKKGLKIAPARETLSTKRILPVESPIKF